MSNENRDDVEDTPEGDVPEIGLESELDEPDSVEPDSDQSVAPDQTSPSIFELFEPPPDIDPNRFGPIPIISDDAEAPGPVSSDDEVVELATAISDPGLLGDPVEDVSAAGALLNDFFGEEPTAGENAKAVSVPEIDDGESAGDLPHWTEPATGQVPAAVAGEGDDDVWSDLSGPRWHGEGPEWAGDDLADVFGFTPASDADNEVIDDTANAGEERPSGAGAPQRGPVPRQRPTQEPAPSGGRNLPQAIMVGILIASIAIGAFYLGTMTTMILITGIAVFGGLELFNKMREVGVHPATLLGTVACGAMPLATYHRGPAGFMLVGALLVVFGALWYITGADSHRPALNLGLTMLGVLWVGGLASFAALIIQFPDTGIAALLFGVVCTVVFDTGAYAGGRAFGKTPFHEASPNKTWEGTIAGFVAAVAAAGILGLFEVSQFSASLRDALIVGAVCGVLAPLGDLTESMIKRDLGVKDMGTLLPGHGGILDRLDGLLFVLPGIYYLMLVLL